MRLGRRLRFGFCCFVLGLLLAAETRFAGAEEKSSPEALAVFEDAANFQNNGAFDLAAEEWAKFLEKFPKDPLAIKAQHYAGVCQLQLKNYEPAIRHFQAVVAGDPKFEFAEDAWLNLGWCRYTYAGQLPAGDKKAADQFREAITTFTKLLNQFPKGNHTDQAWYFLGESQYALGSRPAAMEAFRKVLSDFPDSGLRCETLYAFGVAQEESEQYAEAGSTYDQYLQSCAMGALVTEVRMRKAECLLQTGKVTEAEKLFGEVAAVKDFVSADHALLRQAFAAAKQDRFAEAAALYARLPESFADSKYVVEATLSAGRCFYRAGKSTDAMAWFARAREAGGESATEAAHWMCRLLLQNSKPQEALKTAEDALSLAGQSPFAVNLQLDAADALYELPERRAESLLRYRQLAKDHPQHELAPQALYNAAYTALDLKQFDEASRDAEQFSSAYPEHRLSPDVRYVSAESLLQSGKHAQAEAGLRGLLARPDTKTHPDREKWQLRLGLALYLQKKYDEVIRELTPQIEGLKAPESRAEGRFLIGTAQFALEQFPAARESLAASLEDHATWKQADETLLLLARTDARLNRPQDALAEVQRLLKEFPDSRIRDQAQYRFGEFLNAEGDFSGAASAYEEVLKQWPDSSFAAYARYGKGWALLKAKQYKESANEFSVLLKEFPDHALATESRFARALGLRQTGGAAEAVKDLAKYLAANPDREKRSEALYQQALALIDLKEYSQAVQALTTVLKEHADFAGNDKVLYELAWAHKELKDEGAAGAQFQQLIEKFPRSSLVAEAYFHLGENRYAQGKFAEAAESYDQARQASEPGNVAEQALYKSAWAQFQLARYPAAQAQFAEMADKYPMSKLVGDAYFMEAESLFKQDRFEEALTAFAKAEKVKPSSPQMEVLVLLHAAQSASQLKRWEEGLKRLDAVSSQFPDSPYLAEANYERAWIWHQQGKTDQAMQEYEQAAGRSRDLVGARARFMMGEILFEQKKHGDAIKQFQRVMFGFGGDKAPADVKVWQAKSGLEAARCAEVQINGTQDASRRKQLLEEAKRSFRYVVEKHPQDALAVEAKRRLEQLERL